MVWDARVASSRVAHPDSGPSLLLQLLCSQRKNDEMVFLYALRVSGFHCCRAKTCTICSVVTSSGPDGMSSAARCTILYRRLLIVCADRPAALRVSVHPSMLLRHGTGALILFLMIHHGHPDLHAAKLSLDKLRSPMDLNLGPLVSPEVQGSNPCPATN